MFVETLDDTYRDDICVDTCLHVGTLDCPPYRDELRRYIVAARKNKTIRRRKLGVCPAFEDWSEAAVTVDQRGEIL